MNEQELRRRKERYRREQRRKIRRRRRLIRRLRRDGILLVLCLLILLVGRFIKRHLFPSAEETTDVFQNTVSTQEENTVSILSAGDVIIHSPFLTSEHYLSADGTYDYTSIFKYSRSLYQNADFTVFNLESTISDGNYQGFPLFRAPEAIVSALADSGGDLCLLANNHIYDNFDEGLSLTADAVKANSMSSIGVRKSVSEKKYLIKEIGGIKVGFFNYVYETGALNGQALSINAIPVSTESAERINTFSYDDLPAFYEEIQEGLAEMKEAGVEYTIAYLHWGEEYQTTENERQQTIASQLCELGIDALIGGHPHVVQPVDLLTDTSGEHQMLCVYSLGNHLTNQYRELMGSDSPYGHSEDGLMVELILERTDKKSVSLTDVNFIPTWVYRTPNVGETENPEFFVIPLNDTEKLLKEANLPGLAEDMEESLKRTEEIIGTGTKKVQKALPIKARSNK